MESSVKLLSPFEQTYTITASNTLGAFKLYYLTTNFGLLRNESQISTNQDMRTICDLIGPVLEAGQLHLY